MTNDDIVTRLRAKESRDNRELLDEAAEEIEALRSKIVRLRENCETLADMYQSAERSRNELIRSCDLERARANKLEKALEVRPCGLTG